MASDSIDYAVPLPLTSRAFQLAREFSAQQPTVEKAEQVKLNTLAVCAIDEYLQMMGISTDIEASDSWNPILRLCANVADLEAIGAGRLECRPLHVSETLCHIPQEVWESRIGYAIVQINEAEQQANFLGFMPNSGQEYVPISELQPPEDLIDLLHDRLENSAENLAAIAPRSIPVRIQLSQWLDRVFDAGWQAAETLLSSGSSNPEFAFRGFDIGDSQFGSTLGDESQINPESDPEIRRAKLIDLGLQLSTHRFVLLMAVKPGASQPIEIGIQVHPLDNRTYLPPSLQLTILDDSGEVFMEAQSRSADNYIQLQFSGQHGENFSVQLSLDEASVTENFVI